MKKLAAALLVLTFSGSALADDCQTWRDLAKMGPRWAIELPQNCHLFPKGDANRGAHNLASKAKMPVEITICVAWMTEDIDTPRTVTSERLKKYANTCSTLLAPTTKF